MSHSAVLDYNPFSLEAMTNPQPLYRRLRDEAPIYKLPQYNAWAVSRFEDVWALFRERTRFTEAEGQVFARELLEAPLGETPPAPRLEPLDLFNNLDPPVNMLVRRAMMGALDFGVIDEFEPMLRDVIRQRLDVLEAQGRLDLNGELASYVSAAAACHTVGMATSEAAEVISLVNRSVARAPGRSGITEDGWAAIGDITGRLKATVTARRVGNIPGDPRMIDGLIGLRLPGRGPLNDDEIALQLVSILIGGTESLPKVIAAGFRELANNPEQRAAIAADPAGRAVAAFEEMVRLYAPAQWFGRTLKEDGEICGAHMRAGERVLLLTASANRDDREFADPDVFKWDRPMRRVVAFGMGPHLCIGMHIARLEGRLIVEETLKRFRHFTVDESAGEYAISEFQIGWMKLPIVVKA